MRHAAAIYHEEDFSDDDVGLEEDLEALRQACLRTGTETFLDDDDDKEDDSRPSSSAAASTLATAAVSDSDDDFELFRKLQNRFPIVEDSCDAVPILALPPVSDDEDDFETLFAVQRRFAAYENNETGRKEEEESRNDALDGRDLFDENTEIEQQSEACKLLKLKYSSFPKSAQIFIDAIKKNRSCQRFIRSNLTHIQALIGENVKLRKRVEILRNFHVSCSRFTGRALAQGKDPRIQLMSARAPEVANNKKVSPIQAGPMENSHVANYRKALAMFQPSVEQRKWKDVEMDNLRKGIEQQYQEMVLQYSMDQLSGSEGSTGDANRLDMVLSSIREIEITPEKLREFLPKVNWDRLALLYVSGRSGADCRAWWYNFGDPLINRSCWTNEEEKKLLSIVQERGPYNWPDIAASLGTNRTPFQCLTRYQRSLNPHILNREWTDEEDARLREAVEVFGENNWQAVAAKLERRTGPQCSNRWKKSLDPCRSRKGTWTPEEDKRLKIAVKFFGPKNWNEIAQFVPGRTGVRCRERWANCLDPSLNLGAWTQEEDLKLKAAIQEHGYCWAKIAKCLPQRTDNACKRRWQALCPDEVPLLQAAKKIKKAALINNFVDRESERPTLGLDDFLPPPMIMSILGPEDVHKTWKQKRKSREPGREVENNATSFNSLKRNKSKKASKELPVSLRQASPATDGANDKNSSGNPVVTRRLRACAEKNCSTVSDEDDKLISSLINSAKKFNIKKKKLPEPRSEDRIINTDGNGQSSDVVPAGSSELGLQNGESFITNGRDGAPLSERRFHTWYSRRGRTQPKQNVTMSDICNVETELVYDHQNSDEDDELISSLINSAKKFNRKKKKLPEPHSEDRIINTDGNGQGSDVVAAGRSELGLQNGESFITNGRDGAPLSERRFHTRYSRRGHTQPKQNVTMSDISEVETELVCGDQNSNLLTNNSEVNICPCQPDSSTKKRVPSQHLSRNMELNRQAPLLESSELGIIICKDVEKSSSDVSIKESHASKRTVEHSERCKKSKHRAKSVAKQVSELEDEENSTLASFLRSKSKRRRLEEMKSEGQVCSPSLERRSEFLTSDQPDNGNELTSLQDEILTRCDNGVLEDNS